MNKKNKFTRFALYLLTSMLFMLIIFLIAKSILYKMGLIFRPWVITFMIVICGTSSIILLFCAIIALAKYIILLCKNHKARFIYVFKGFTCIVGIFVCIAAIIGLGWWTLISGVFSYEPEHVIERDNRKMIACVNSFTHVYVEYHDYKNILVMENKTLISEDYGSGGYDPLKTGQNCKPKNTTYYYKK